MSDFIIDNVDIYDGSGGKPVMGSVAVSGDRITAVGQVSSTIPVETRIDGKGLALAPGIIDSHTHFNAQVTWGPMVTPSPEHGVTTALIGDCGFTIAPCRPADRELTMQNLVRVEGMSLEAMRAGINWEFESFDDYLALIERQGVGPNIAAFVGHSSVRTYVMGSDAPLRSATVDEAERVDPLDFMFDLALSEELETTFLSVLLNSDESAVARLLTHEYSTVALSDAGAH